ncbi:acyl-CoA reductase-like NAD-dependent aldehyde dehydrogenase [Methylopila capsulata]|uniref:Aldehyde dehydrogenase n=1 Tax=Methylopila capsulata TaxID=61654 RepID=A0A9W6IVI7_9HYPH|nr:aldehyde dehydrogenase family protein [Methylopila capsulata]MBM7853483.1 acyl-CoA reductase-like NAD-dependent aldehyde dehydrogenase [Methylopila capsulata]GLK57303.1 aldehyde dehydrogenase [Methylopila capsulata]
MTDLICISPIDGREVARRPIDGPDVVAAAVADATRAQKDWAKVSVAERGQKMLAFLEALLGLNQQIIPELALQMGRPVRYGGEMRGVEERVKHCVTIAEKALAPLVPEPKPGFRRMIKRTPIGVVLVIAPWNYPFLTAVNTIVPALIAGNAVLLKHANQTILAGERLQEAMDTAGLPKGLFRNLYLGHDETSDLIRSGAVGHINFTGSVGGGRAIERAAAGTFASLGLELGGKDPAYVRADADLDFAIENLADGAFYNSGQCCCGIERVYVHESLYDRFVDGVVEAASKYVLGNPLDDATTLGPMSATRFAETVRAQTAEAIAKGAKAHLDPRAFAADKAGTPYLAPQVLTNVDHSMSVMMEESFGPVVGIMKVSGDEEALRLMNDSPYGLTASIWTKDVDLAEALGDRVETGTVFMNRCDYLDPALAWTGVKDTGRGAGLSEIGFHTLTRPKSFHLREAT